MSRIQRINELLKSELADLINKEIPLDEALITVSYVDCAPDLKSAKIGISIFPNNRTGSAIKAVRKKARYFRAILKKKLNLKIIPKLRILIDDRERHVDEIEEILKKA